MNIEEQKVKDCLKDYLISKGLRVDGENFSCPFHKDDNPSARYYCDTNTVYCFSCRKPYDIFDFIGNDYNLDNKQAYKKGFELYGDKKIFNSTYQPIKEKVDKPLIDYTDTFKEWNKALLENKQAIDYIKNRGIDLTLIDKFNLGYDKKYNTIVFPKDKYTYISRSIIGKTHFKQGERTFFNQSALFNNESYCIITEGEFDCLSFESMGCNAISLGGITSINNLAKLNLPQNKTYILALDNDEKGIKATNELKNLLSQQNLMVVAMEYNVPYKDPNEYLTSEYERFKGVCESIKNGDLKDNSEKKEKTKLIISNTLERMNEFDDYVEKTKTLTPFPTGFESLDKILDGGIKEGLTTIIAIPGIGKTTFSMQIADNVAKQGRDVLIFALEMSRNELIAKSLSRISYEKGTSRHRLFQTSNTFLFGYMQKDLSEDVREFMNECKQEYMSYAEHLFIDESEAERTIKSIGEIIDNHIKATNSTPLVIIDYAQIIAPSKDNLTDKKNMDEIVLELKRLTRRLHIPIIAISSINRASYDEVLSLSSAKESGGIEFTSTVLLGLQYKPTKKKDGKYIVDNEEQGKKAIKEIDLKVIKNRFGESYKTINLNFYPDICYFKETNSENESENLRTSRRNNLSF